MNKIIERTTTATPNRNVVIWRGVRYSKTTSKNIGVIPQMTFEMRRKTVAIRRGEKELTFKILLDDLKLELASL
jgi:hypothetical protein